MIIPSAKRRRNYGRTAAALASSDRKRSGPRAVFDPLKPDEFALALDTREQIIGFVPLEIPIVVGKLPMGDLSVPGFEDRAAIDRKQIGDFIGCVTRDKERFTRLLEKMSKLDFAAIVVEATLADVRARKYRNDVPPAFVIGAAAKITAKYDVPVFFCGSLDSTTDFAVRLLRFWWREKRHGQPKLKAVGASV
jgi:DNA excision repair protein ERCC-4